jgi:putative two-component system response regulator
MIPRGVQDATILVVDDEPVNLELLEALLGGAGYTRVTSTTDPRRVLELYHQLAPDLVMLDLRMPHLDGFAVMRQLRQAQPHGSYLPILMLTAEAASERRQRALAEGATDFLHKPFDPVEVLLRIANLLETRRLHTELRLHNDLLEQRIRERTAEIEQARADLARIAHAAAHDLVEPVRMVGINAQLLARRHGQALDGEAAQCLRYLVEGSARAYDLIGGLLTVAEKAAASRADAAPR